jgi:hypothetical protein
LISRRRYKKVQAWFLPYGYGLFQKLLQGLDKAAKIVGMYPVAGVGHFGKGKVLEREA